MSYRLTVRYVLVFAAVSLVVLAASDTALKAHLAKRAEEDLLEDAAEMEAVYREKGLARLEAEFDREARSSGADTVFFVVYAPDGTQLAASPMADWQQVRLPLPGADALKPGEHLDGLERPAGHAFAARLMARRWRGGELICLGHSTEDEEELLAMFREGIGSALGMMLLAGGLLGWWLARRAMAGVVRVTETAVRIGRAGFADRVTVRDEGKEIDQLALAFNDMLERIDSLVTDLREVINSIAHDLHSPITRLRGMAETTLTSPSSEDDYRELAANVIEESDRLTQLINTILDIAETETEMPRRGDAKVDFNALVSDMHELFEPAARDSGIDLILETDGRPIELQGDADRLRRVVSNLLDNAIKHTPQGGAIRLTLTTDNGFVELSVADNGEGISAADLPHVFKRFYRADTSRSKSGHGLGLSLCESIVRRHGGLITVTSTPGAGSTFRVRLPLVS